MNKATVIAAFYNKIDYLKLVLAGFERQTTKEFEFIIADDGSAENVVSEINNIQTSYPFPIKHIWQEDKGFRKNKILNKAVNEAESDYLIFIDADCVPVLRFFASRVEQFPQFRRRLVSVPLSLDRPYWVEESAIDVEVPVRHVALPHPGDWRQLCIQVARLHSRPLDRSKPLWEAYVIEGLHNVPGAPPGSFALYCKMHHAIVDGESGTEFLKAMHSLSPEPVEDDDVPAGGFTADREPSLPELYSRALIQNIEKLPSLARFSFGTAKRLATLGVGTAANLSKLGSVVLPQLRALLSGDLSALLSKLPPQTRFSGEVSAHRVFEAAGLPLADFRTIRQQVGNVTLNDLFLAIVGGALNRYLGEKGELPDTSMIALFYAGMVRAKNGLSVMMQCFTITCPITVLWVLFLYSLAFGADVGGFIGGLGKAFMAGVGIDSLSGSIPETVFAMFQLTFAIITPALIVGAFAERMKFSAMLWFMAAWVTLVYAPVAHWVWGGGWLSSLGVLDFAGGTVVHINAGVAGLMAALVLGRRGGYPGHPMKPSNLVLTIVGAGMLASATDRMRLIDRPGVELFKCAIEHNPNTSNPS